MTRTEEFLPLCRLSFRPCYRHVGYCIVKYNVSTIEDEILEKALIARFKPTTYSKSNPLACEPLTTMLPRQMVKNTKMDPSAHCISIFFFLSSLMFFVQELLYNNLKFNQSLIFWLGPLSQSPSGPLVHSWD